MSEPADPMRLLVVCTANICRSPLAERVLRHELEGAAAFAGMVVASAGTRALVGAGMCEVSAAELPSGSDPPAGHHAQEVTPESVRAATLVLTMEREQRSDVVRLAPGSQGKVFTLREALGLLEVLQQRGGRPVHDLAGLARAMHSVRGLAVGPPPPPKRRWWQRPEEPADPLTIVDGHGADIEAHERAAHAVHETAEAFAAAVRAVTARTTA